MGEKKALPLPSATAVGLDTGAVAERRALREAPSVEGVATADGESKGALCEGEGEACSGEGVPVAQARGPVAVALGEEEAPGVALAGALALAVCLAEALALPPPPPPGAAVGDCCALPAEERVEARSGEAVPPACPLELAAALALALLQALGTAAEGEARALPVSPGVSLPQPVALPLTGVALPGAAEALGSSVTAGVSVPLGELDCRGAEAVGALLGVEAGPAPCVLVPPASPPEREPVALAVAQSEAGALAEAQGEGAVLGESSGVAVADPEGVGEPEAPALLLAPCANEGVGRAGEGVGAGEGVAPGAPPLAVPAGEGVAPGEGGALPDASSEALGVGEALPAAAVSEGGSEALGVSLGGAEAVDRSFSEGEALGEGEAVAAALGPVGPALALGGEEGEEERRAEPEGSSGEGVAARSGLAVVSAEAVGASVAVPKAGLPLGSAVAGAVGEALPPVALGEAGALGVAHEDARGEGEAVTAALGVPAAAALGECCSGVALASAEALALLPPTPLLLLGCAGVAVGAAGEGVPPPPALAVAAATLALAHLLAGALVLAEGLALPPCGEPLGG